MTDAIPVPYGYKFGFPTELTKKTGECGMFKFILCCVLIFTLGDEVSAAPRVVRLTSVEWPPFFSPDLPSGGMMSRIISEAFRAAGVQVQYVYFPWVRAYEEARVGRYDGTVGLAPNPERLQWFDFSDVVMNAEMPLGRLHRRA